jgi:OmpA family/Putative peptidoglycan binding domain
VPEGRVQGDDEIVVETAFRTFVVRVDRFRQTSLTEAQRDDALRLVSELRFGLGFDRNLQVAAQRLAHAVIGTGPVRLRRLDAKIETQRFFEQLREFLEEQLETGRLIVLEEPAIANVPEQELTVRRPRLDPQPPAQLIPRREAPLQTSFEVRFVDEVGQAISGLKVQIAAGDRVESVTTNAAGVALLEGTTAGSGTVTVLDPAALEKILEPRWAKKRIGSPPSGLNRTEQLFDGRGLDATAIKGGVPNTVVIKPKLGKLFVELWDKFGRVRHANRKYSITGPQSFDGSTDELGQVRQEDVLGGDYMLTLSLDFPDDFGIDPQTLEIPLVTLAPGEASPQLRLVGAVPHVELVRLMGAFFETNKSFLTPDGVASLAEVEDIYRDNNPSQLLVVGHTDTTADAATNDPLSLERATNMMAFLRDDVNTWLKMYSASSRQWGSREDQAMFGAVDDDVGNLTADQRVRRFQRTRCLTVDGVVGQQTRKQLIKEYMALDGATLSEPGFVIPITAHGCGENFPLDDSGDDLDPTPADAKEDGLDRRVELFFFDADLGIQPPPPGKNSPAGSTQYPEWRKRALASKDVQLIPPRRVFLVDEQGSPLPLEPYELLTADGQTLSGVADENGQVTLPVGIGNDVTLRLISMVSEVQLAAT